ncbi:flagellar hook-basal body complex protein [Polynucleobacter paneuropaeus]|nr:flagellar hook-basal body complex protein [Polynucleobacter paneuropaeus]
MAFETGLSGLQAASENLNVLGQNIANVNTYGYKSASTDFSNVLSSHLNAADSGSGVQLGQGAMISNIKESFAQGSITGTSSSLDAAITGPGFFITYDTILKQTSYTRNGNFTTDNKGVLINGNGQNVLGYTASVGGTNGTVTAGGTPAPINLTTLNLNPYNAANLTPEVNSVQFYTLNNQGTATVGGLTLTNNSGQYLSASQIVSAFAGLTPGSTGGTPPTGCTFSGTLGNYTLTAAAGSDTLTATGTMTNGQSTPTIQATVFSPIGDLSPSIAVTTKAINTAYLTDYSIDAAGVITGKYSDGSTYKLAQLALATFQSNTGLKSSGNDSWMQTAASGAPIIGSPGLLGVGAITGSSLEASNTDQTGDMVKLLAAQQAYQSNAQTIKVEDQNYQTLIAMGG